MGLGRAGTSYTGEHYIKKLYEGNVISEEKFSLSLDNTSTNSYIDYGPPDTTQYKSGETPVYIPMAGTVNPYWQQITDGFYFSSYPDKKYTTEAKLGIVDSGWTVLSMP